ncbi:MAG: response regulator transcription factor [Acidobacteria bacterium]|nr:response regulator transcription factor [Acidobacteriota bacterium]
MTRPAQILLVDDEMAIQRAIAPLLRSRGYAVTLAATGREALDAFERDRPDIVILDLGLPDMDGTEVCRLLRERAETPILVLSARGAEKDKVTALDQGADDYITKPFGPEELMARVRAALRRSLGRDTPLHGQLTRGDLTIDFDRRRVGRGDLEVRLTPKEFELLTLLVSHAGRVLTHRSILKSIWGTHSTDQPEHLRVLVGQLRKKIEPDPGHPRYLITEPWVGYRFADEPE